MKIIFLKMIGLVIILLISQNAWCGDDESMPDIGTMSSDPWADYSWDFDDADKFVPDFSPRASVIGEDLNAAGAISYYGDFGEEPKAKAASVSCMQDQTILGDILGVQRAVPASVPKASSSGGTAN
jgi:hypothetical protein